MSVAQIKDRPASALRAMFAGIGSLLSVVDKVRSKPAAEAPADVDAPAPEASESAEAPAAAAPETAAEPDTAAAEPAAVVAETTVADTTVADTTVEPATAAALTAAGELPLPNYEELTVASLRARLRNLSNDDLAVLVAYEEAHQNRPEVVKMFKNRVIKMTSSFPKLEA